MSWNNLGMRLCRNLDLTKEMNINAIHVDRLELMMNIRAAREARDSRDDCINRIEFSSTRARARADTTDTEFGF